MSTSARNANGSRTDRRGSGRPASQVAHARRAPARHGRATAPSTRRRSRRSPSRRRSRSPAGARARDAIEPAQAVMARRKAHEEQRAHDRGAPARRQRRKDPDRGPIGGSHSHSPSQDTARNSPITVTSAASGGHSRSHRIAQRARVERALKRDRRRLGVRPAGGLRRVGHRSVKRFSGCVSAASQYHITPEPILPSRQGRNARADCHGRWIRRSAVSHGGIRSSAIRASTSTRGRTSAHSAPFTSTSGTSARVL